MTVEVDAKSFLISVRLETSNIEVCLFNIDQRKLYGENKEVTRHVEDV